MSPHSTIPFPSRHRAQVARAAGLALLAAVAVCLIAGAVLAFRSGSVEPGWEPDAAFAWTMLWLPAGCRLAVPALLLMASFANSGGASAALFGSPAAALLHWWFTGLAYPLSEAAIILAGFCLPGIPAEDPATLAKDGAGRREWWFFSASAACLALLLVFNILRSVHLKPVRIEVWSVLLSLGHMAVPVAACLALGVLARRSSGRERWRLHPATPIVLLLGCGACFVVGHALSSMQWNGLSSLSPLLCDLFYLAWPVWLCSLVRSRHQP